MAIRVTIAPTEEPVTLQEVKEHCRIDLNDDDLLLTGLIRAARDYCESFTGRAFVNRVLRYSLNEWPSGGIYLPRPPTIEVLSVEYRLEDAALPYTDFLDFDIDTTGVFAKIVPDDTWPDGDLHPSNAINIEFTAGYDGAANVPEIFKSAIKLCVGSWYENREGVLPAGHIGRELPMGVNSLLWTHRVFWTEDLNK